MKTLTLSLLLLSSAFAGSDSLLNTKILARVDNQVRISLASPCSPCALYWHAEGQGDKLIVNLYGTDTVKVQYDFQGFNSQTNSLQLFEGGKLRSTLPFVMDYPIPEAIPNKKRQIVQVQLYKTRYLVSGRPWARGGWMVGK
jgi:hypothetical protein